jgi:hypothetical protein
MLLERVPVAIPNLKQKPDRHSNIYFGGGGGGGRKETVTAPSEVKY